MNTSNDIQARPRARFPALAALSLGLLLPATSAHAGARASTAYSVPADTVGAGGARAASVAYTNQGNLGGVGGVSTVAAPAETARHGYLGQLTEVTALQLTATPTTLNEGATRLLSATAALHDGTTARLPAAEVAWSVQAGPLSGISATGLATGAPVHQDTAATARGLHNGISGTLGLTVLNVNTDNLPGYAADGLDDAWQVQYFGLGNPNAAPGVDPDSDGQNNLFEFTAGVDPTSAASLFSFRGETPASLPNRMSIVIHPRLSDRTYTVQESSNPASGAAWSPLVGFQTSDNGLTRIITDTGADEARKFYRIEIRKP